MSELEGLITPEPECRARGTAEFPCDPLAGEPCDKCGGPEPCRKRACIEAWAADALYFDVEAMEMAHLAKLLDDKDLEARVARFRDVNSLFWRMIQARRDGEGADTEARLAHWNA